MLQGRQPRPLETLDPSVLIQGPLSAPGFFLCSGPAEEAQWRANEPPELAAPERTPELLTEDLIQHLSEEALTLAKKLISEGNVPRVQRRFLSALTCQGHITFWDTAVSTGRIFAVESMLGLGDLYLKKIMEYSQKKHCFMILCPDPLSPKKTEAVLLPEQKLSFISVRKRVSIPIPVWRRIRLDPMADQAKLRHKKQIFRACEMLQHGLLGEAYACLEAAKSYHDELEAIYNPFVDFKEMDLLCRKHMDMQK